MAVSVYQAGYDLLTATAAATAARIKGMIVGVLIPARVAAVTSLFSLTAVVKSL